ncbi:unnamed protein product [Caenorhabditis nigoni]
MDGRSMDTEIVEMICEAIKDLAFLMSQADNARNSDEGIEAIEIVVERFVQQVRTLLPDYGVTTKMHLLSAHLIPYLREHGTWGRVTEQGIESFRCLFKRLEVRFASIRNVELQILLILEQLSHFKRSSVLVARGPVSNSVASFLCFHVFFVAFYRLAGINICICAACVFLSK